MCPISSLASSTSIHINQIKFNALIYSALFALVECRLTEALSTIEQNCPANLFSDNNEEDLNRLIYYGQQNQSFRKEMKCNYLIVMVELGE